MSKRRPTDRDVFIPKHTATPEFIEDQGTGNCSGDDLRRVRSRRPTSKRLEMLEAKDDQRAEDIAEIKVAVADIRGDQKAQNVALSSIQKSLERQAARDDAEFVADVSVDAAQKKDVITAQAEKRALALKALGLLLGGGVIGKLGNMLGLW